ncbi:MAG TPA: DHA2 family efflux MFS transporter permease subunit [Candidatus Angelobacter sp.]|nr:DHA2 family efflux MFS transporter permease subunit [Candidatus Angelobacter sp.]
MDDAPVLRNQQAPAPPDTPESRAAVDTLGEAAPQPAAPHTTRFDYKWVALTVVLFGTVMTILDATVVNVALPTLQSQFNSRSYNDISWVVTAYLLAQGAVIPVTGWITDRFGTKRIYLLTLVLFTLASALCGLAWNLPALIIFRVLQGIGGGMIMPIGMTIILRAVGPSQMGRVMGIFGVPMLLGPAIGPVLGGWLVQDFTWRLIFYINLPIGVAALIAAYRYLRETPYSHTMKLDWIGFMIGTPAVVALMYGVDRSTELGWTSPLVLSLLAIAVVLFIAFIWRQRTTSDPLLHLELFRDGTFTASVLLGFVLVTALFGVMLLLPLYLQQVHGYDALHTGLALTPQAVTAALFMPIGGFLTDRIGPRPVVMVGLGLLVVGSVLLAQLHVDSPSTLVVAALALRGVAMGFAMMPGMSAGLARIPPHLTSRASSITNTAQRVGSSIGIAVLVTVLAAQVRPAAAQAPCDPPPAVLSSPVTHRIAGVPATTQLTADQVCTVLRAQAAASSQNQRGEAAPPSTGDPAVDSFLKSFGDRALTIAFDRTFAFTAIITAFGFIPALFLRKPPKSAGARPALEAA